MKKRSRSRLKRSQLFACWLLVANCSLPSCAQLGYSSLGDRSHGVVDSGSSGGGIISSPSLKNFDASSGLFTRKSNFEDATGIGGSTLQTTSVFAESRPALVPPSTVQLQTSTLSRPNLSVQSSFKTLSPALTPFSSVLSRPTFGASSPSAPEAGVNGLSKLRSFTDTQTIGAPRSLDLEFGLLKSPFESEFGM